MEIVKNKFYSFIFEAMGTRDKGNNLVKSFQFDAVQPSDFSFPLYLFPQS